MKKKSYFYGSRAVANKLGFRVIRNTIRHMWQHGALQGCQMIAYGDFDLRCIASGICPLSGIPLTN